MGCGSGNRTFVLKNRFKDADIIGVDYSENMLEKAKNKLSRYDF
ncbi:MULTISPECIES: class I SAM-dependent methyltransferase [Ruminococcus]|nr:methyltransferase domain-containing protein [Ruminococcus sp.]